MAKSSGTTKYQGSSASSAAKSAGVLPSSPVAMILRGQTSSSISTASTVPTTAYLYEQIGNLYNSAYKEQTFSNGDKSASILYNIKMDMFKISLKENGKLIAKGAKTTSDAYTAAGIIRKHIK